MSYITRLDLEATVDCIDWYRTNDKGILVQGARNETEAYVRFSDVLRAIEEQAIVDAIPVEQVARMLYKATGDVPCNWFFIDERDEWCEEHYCYDECDSVDIECWLHALKEGWLDEE